MTTRSEVIGQEFTEQQIASLLEYHYGDGWVYIPRFIPNHLYSLAKNLGFINAEGYLTHKGRALLARNY